MLPDPPSTLEPVRQHRGRAAITDALTTVAATIRTQHAIVGEVYDDGPRPALLAGASRASPTTGYSTMTRSVTWCGICATTTNIGAHADTWRIYRRALTIDAIETRSARQVRPWAFGRGLFQQIDGPGEAFGRSNHQMHDLTSPRGVLLGEDKSQVGGQ